MALDNCKCNHLMPLQFKGLIRVSLSRPMASVSRVIVRVRRIRVRVSVSG